jgi:hypothetical protein
VEKTELKGKMDPKPIKNPGGQEGRKNDRKKVY